MVLDFDTCFCFVFFNVYSLKPLLMIFIWKKNDDQSPYGSIHPRDKGSVADRLVLGARALVYGEKDVNFKGPILEKCDLIKYDGSYAARIRFRGVEKEGINFKSNNGFEVCEIFHFSFI